MTPYGHLVKEVAPFGLHSLGDQLVTYQCHHHSLFLDQTVSDALGGEGWAVSGQAAFEAANALLASFYAEFGIIDPEERLELAGELFSAMGQGRLVFEISAEGGTVRGHELHYGSSFREKYATRLRNRRPVDTFAAGFVSAAASLAFPSGLGHARSRRDRLASPAATSSASSPSLRRPERPPLRRAVVTRPLVEGLPSRRRLPEVPRPSPASAQAPAREPRPHAPHRPPRRERRPPRLRGPRGARAPSATPVRSPSTPLHSRREAQPRARTVGRARSSARPPRAAPSSTSSAASSPRRYGKGEHGPPDREPEQSGWRPARRPRPRPRLGARSRWRSSSLAAPSCSPATSPTRARTTRPGMEGRRKTRLYFQQGLALAP